MVSKELICEIQVTLSSVCFGLSFVGQRIAATHDEADPMTYNSWRFLISIISIFLIKEKLKLSMKTNISATANYEQDEIPFLNYLYRLAKYFSINDQTFHLYFWGILGGIVNFGVQACQQYGLQTVSAGKAALINGLFVVVAPFIESILPYFVSNINLRSWCAIMLSGVGTYFLSSPDSGGFGFGEFLLVLSMLGCCFGILISDVASKRVDCIDVTFIELTTVVIFSTVFSLWMHPEFWYWPLSALRHGFAMVICVGVSEAVGYSLGTLGQMHIPSHRASVLYGLEGAFAVFFGYLFLG
jgi:drug/metabolite transporter (DMT)-like permease